MVSSKDAKEVGNREHHTHNGICVAFHLRFAAEKEWRVFISFPIRFFWNRSIEMKGHVAVTQSSNAAGKTIKKRGVPTKFKSSATRATSESTNSTGIKQSNNSRGTLLLARLLWSIFNHLGIKQQFGYVDHAGYMTLQSVLRTLQFKLSMQAIVSLSILNTMSTPSALHRLSSTPRSLSQAAS